MIVAADLMRRGYKIAFPYGEDWDYDLIVCRGEKLERVQVKYSRSNGEVICVRCSSNSLTNGKVRSVKRYTVAMIDWIAVWDPTSDSCYYIPAQELGKGRSNLYLRLTPARSGRTQGINRAHDYVDI